MKQPPANQTVSSSIITRDGVLCGCNVTRPSKFWPAVNPEIPLSSLRCLTCRNEAP